MPSERATAASLGREARARSRRERPSAFICPDDAHPTTSAAKPTATSERIETILRASPLLTVWIEHVLEPHPLGIEIQIDVPETAVPVFPDEQLRGALDLTTPVVHVFSKERQHDVRVVFDGAHGAKVVELRAPVVARGQVGKLSGGEYGDMLLDCQRLQAPNRVRQLFVRFARAAHQILQ